MKKIKIGYFADGPWSHLAFERIIKDPAIEVLFIVPRNDTKDQTLKQFSETYHIDYLEKVYVNRPEFIQVVQDYGAELLVSMSYNQIFRQPIIDATPLGIINCHAGKLPFYRGRNILNWALINDEKEFGITAHFVDTGIDTGDIILQRTYPITDEDNYGTLLNKAYVECAVIIHEAIGMVRDGNYKRLKQTDIHPVGMYCGQRTIGDEWLNWNQSSREVFNFVRAVAVPGPMAHSKIKGTEAVIKINKLQEIPQAPTYKGIPGQVIGKTAKTFIIKTQDSFVELLEWELEGVKLRIGSRLE